MNRKQTSMVVISITAVLLTSACGLMDNLRSRFLERQTEREDISGILPLSPAVASVERIEGDFTFTNDFVLETYFNEHAVVLNDLTGFVLRDEEWELPAESQVLGRMTVDAENKQGTFDLQLPVRPRGVASDVNPDDQKEVGLQIFAVAYGPNLSGGPFSEGDDKSYGWPSYLASVRTDTENNDEVVGGKLVIFAPDADQDFPAGFGTDGLLFTADDPMMTVPAGYSVIDLDQTPFAQSRKAVEKMTLYEPADVAEKDYSALSYTEAFEKMFEKVSQEYAFNGIAGKQPDWQQLKDSLLPRVKNAQKARDPKEYYLALQDFANAFNDGHVGLGGGEIGQQIYSEMTAGGFGFSIRELDDQRVIVTFVLPGGPADQAGIQVGAELKSVSATPVGEAIGRVKPLSGPFSTEFSRRYEQVRFLLAAPVGTEKSFTFSNPGEEEQTLTLTAVYEQSSLQFSSTFRNFDSTALPVEFRILDSGLGYVKINSNYDDLNLIVRLFERALSTFEENAVAGVIIDLRTNTGGSPLDLAGYLTREEIPLAELQYFSEKTGQFEPDGPIGKVRPKETQFSFDSLALLVDQSCYSACEIEAYGFSQLPGIQVVGQYPTAGVEAEVARGQYILPEDFTLQVPTGRFVKADGSIFLEGQGVQPTVKVPIDENLALSQTDVILQTAENLLLIPSGADREPDGPLVFGSPEESQQAANSGAPFLDALAQEYYLEPPLLGQVQPYTIFLTEPEPALLLTFWCAADENKLANELANLQTRVTINGSNKPIGDFRQVDSSASGQACRYYFTLIKEWPAGKHQIEVSQIQGNAAAKTVYTVYAGE